MTTETRATERLLSRIRQTESELRGQLDRIHGCLERIDRIQADDIARFHGLLLTLQCSLDTVRSLDRTSVAGLLEAPETAA